MKSEVVTANPANPRISMGGVFLYAGFAAGLLYLLLHQLGNSGMVHRGTPLPGVALLRETDGIVARAAGGRAVQLHMQASPLDWENNGAFLARIYFSAVYQQYPLPVVIGDERAVINFPLDLQHADRLTPDTWLRDHEVASVVTLIPPREQSGWQAIIHRVP